jgi:hypothetical protein
VGDNHIHRLRPPQNEPLPSLMCTLSNTYWKHILATRVYYPNTQISYFPHNSTQHLQVRLSDNLKITVNSMMQMQCVCASSVMLHTLNWAKDRDVRTSVSGHKSSTRNTTQPTHLHDVHIMHVHMYRCKLSNGSYLFSEMS